MSCLNVIQFFFLSEDLQLSLEPRMLYDLLEIKRVLETFYDKHLNLIFFCVGLHAEILLRLLRSLLSQITVAFTDFANTLLIHSSQFINKAFQGTSAWKFVACHYCNEENKLLFLFLVFYLFSCSVICDNTLPLCPFGTVFGLCLLKGSLWKAF